MCSSFSPQATIKSSSFSVSPDCLKIDLNVPNGISFLFAGTITVSVGFPILRNFA
jgi:hypothetical protein